MNRWKRAKPIPAPLLIVVCVFGAIPLWSIWWVEWSMPKLIDMGLWRAVLLVAGYWVGPLAIMIAALRHNFSVIPLFIIESIVLLLHGVINIHHLPDDLQSVRYLVLLGSIFWFSLAFLTRDSLYPLLAGNARPWRLSPRLYTHQPVWLWYGDDRTHWVEVILDNCSVSGMGIKGNEIELKAFLERKEMLSSFIFYLGNKQKEWMLNGRIARFERWGDKLFVGFEVYNTLVMQDLMSCLLIKGPRRSMRGLLMQLRLRSGLQQAAAGLWGLCILAFFLVPSCSRYRVNSNQLTKVIPEVHGQAPGSSPESRRR